MPARRVARLLVPLAALFAPGCGCVATETTVSSNKVDEQAIRQTLHVTYPGGRPDTTQVAAWFSAGNNHVVLLPPSGVTADGRPLDPRDDRAVFSPTHGRYYQSEQPGLRQQTEVRFTAPSGKVYTNTLRLERADFVADQPTEWRVSKVLTVPFAGPPLAAGEEVTLTLTSATKPADGPGAAATYRETRVGSTAVHIHPVIAEPPTGDLIAVWKRTGTQTLQQGTPAGGEITSTYHSPELKVKVVR